MFNPHQQVTRDHEVAGRLVKLYSSGMIKDTELHGRAEIVFNKIGQTHESKFASVSRATIKADKAIVGRWDPKDGLDIMDDDYEEQLHGRCLNVLQDLETRY